MRNEDKIDDGVSVLLAPLRAEEHRLDADRQRAVWLRISTDLETPPMKRRWLWVGVTTAAAAAIALFVLTPTAPSGVAGSVVSQAVTPNETDPADKSRAVLPSGSVATTLHGIVRVLENSKTRTRIELATGAAVSSVVEPIEPGGYYVVQTPNATVSVRGTQFITRVIGAMTEVTVSDGKVHVSPKDGRRARLVRAGERFRVQPLTHAGADAAIKDQDARSAAEILAHLARAESGLKARNLLLRAGRLVHENHAVEAAVIWAEASRLHPEGVHAEEFAFRLGDAWHRAGALSKAKAAGLRFRTRFPNSSRATATQSW